MPARFCGPFPGNGAEGRADLGKPRAGSPMRHRALPGTVTPGAN